MEIKVLKTNLETILPFRKLFLQETNFQVRYNACHERGWTDSYIIMAGEAAIGYGSVKGKDNIPDRDAIFEFYLVPQYKKLATTLFEKLISISGVSCMECQSNDLVLTSLLYEFTQNIQADVILFEDNIPTELSLPGIIFRTCTENDLVFEHASEPKGDYVLESANKIVATGGFMRHYNFPFADLYMEVQEEHRMKGLGSFLIQELKKQCYLSGRVPAARCGLTNIASRATLLKAGLKIAGFMLTGNIKIK